MLQDKADIEIISLSQDGVCILYSTSLKQVLEGVKSYRYIEEIECHDQLYRYRPRTFFPGFFVPKTICPLRWKSLRLRIYRLAYRITLHFQSIPQGMVFFQKSQTFGKSLETFESRIFFLRCLKSIGWYGFFQLHLPIENKGMDVVFGLHCT